MDGTWARVPKACVADDCQWAFYDPEPQPLRTLVRHGRVRQPAPRCAPIGQAPGLRAAPPAKGSSAHSRTLPPARPGAGLPPPDRYIDAGMPMPRQTIAPSSSVRCTVAAVSVPPGRSRRDPPRPPRPQPADRQQRRGRPCDAGGVALSAARLAARTASRARGPPGISGSIGDDAVERDAGDAEQRQPEGRRQRTRGRRQPSRRSGPRACRRAARPRRRAARRGLSAPDAPSAEKPATRWRYCSAM